jgi:hypothetical protein
MEVSAVLNAVDALKQKDRYEEMYGERADPVKVTAMKAGVSYRRALEALGPDDDEQRNLLTGFIALESPHLYSLLITEREAVEMQNSADGAA